MMHAPVGRRRPRDDEATHFVMSDFALGNDDLSMLFQVRGKSKMYPALGFSADSGPALQQQQQGVGTTNDAAVYSGGGGGPDVCAQTQKNDVAAPMRAEASLFSTDEYTETYNVICSPENNTVRPQDEHKNRGNDLFLFDWPELAPLEDFGTDLRKLDSRFEIGSNYFDDPMWPSICSPDAQLVPSSLIDNHPNSSTVANNPILQSAAPAPAPAPDTATDQEINTSNPMNMQQQQQEHLSRSKTPLMNSSSSVEIEHFPRISDADLFFCPFDDMLVPTSSSTMYCNDEIMSSSTATLSGPDIIPRCSAKTKKKKKPHATTPDMMLDEMAGNPLEMYFPPLTTDEQPEAPMGGAASTQMQHQLLPEGYFAGNGAAALNSSGLEFCRKGRKAPGGGGLRESPRSSSAIKAAPAKNAGFQKLQEGMNQLDVGAKTCIRDALYRLANSLERKHCVDQTVVAGSSGAANRLGSSVWTETQGSPMDRSVAQLLLRKPLHGKTTDLQANRVAS
uniref:Uncharacterized protein n=1 Tax=Avena sativa TaxID=4498 RepID=A0ACD5YQ93_AVESA